MNAEIRTDGVVQKEDSRGTKFIASNVTKVQFFNGVEITVLTDGTLSVNYADFSASDRMIIAPSAANEFKIMLMKK